MTKGVEWEASWAYSQGATNPLKNKGQVDVNGNPVRSTHGTRIRPDASYNLNGTRNNTNYVSNHQLDNTSDSDTNTDGIRVTTDEKCVLPPGIVRLLESLKKEDIPRGLLVRCESNGNGGSNGGGNGDGEITYEAAQYYYHPDHLGSASFITDENGRIYEHLEYFPFGEAFAHEHNNTQITPYWFTGKELDEMTGRYYFGARYYDPRTSVWQSPDPILDDYLGADPQKLTNGGMYNPFNLGLYTYTYNAPVKLVDPDGNVVNILFGGLLGAASDLAIQGVMIATGAQDSISWGEVGVSAALGASGVGLASVAQKGYKTYKTAKQANRIRANTAKSKVTRSVASKNIPRPASLSNEASRKWYHSQLDSIPSQIDPKLPLRERALQAFKMRNDIKLQARELMSDRATANSLPAPKTLQDVVRKAYKQGLRGDDAF